MSTSTADNGRVALITGAGRGIGLEYARAFLDAGYRVAFADVVTDVETIAKEEQSAGRAAMGIVMDVSDEASVASAVAAVTSELGPPVVLINNAALFSTLPFTEWRDIDSESWDRVMGVNVKGPFLCAKACLPAMEQLGWGRIINISSTVFMVGGHKRLHYATSKAAVVGFTRALAKEVGPMGVTVNSIAPGSTESSSVLEKYPSEMLSAAAQMRAIPRAEVPNDLVGAALFFASDAAGFITGQTLVVDGGHVFA